MRPVRDGIDLLENTKEIRLRNDERSKFFLTKLIKLLRQNLS